MEKLEAANERQELSDNHREASERVFPSLASKEYSAMPRRKPKSDTEILPVVAELVFGSVLTDGKSRENIS
ncbi:MAG: hypothetical protein ACKO96_45175, partial [Flammeovirgaceae bacterium]